MEAQIKVSGPALCQLSHVGQAAPTPWSSPSTLTADSFRLKRRVWVLSICIFNHLFSWIWWALKFENIAFIFQFAQLSLDIKRGIREATRIVSELFWKEKKIGLFLIYTRAKQEIVFWLYQEPEVHLRGLISLGTVLQSCLSSPQSILLYRCLTL